MGVVVVVVVVVVSYVLSVFSDDGMFLHNGAYTVKSISTHAHLL